MPTSASRASTSFIWAPPCSIARGYDAASNVTAVNTTLAPGGTASTDNQIFCYDEQNRLVWAGSTGTPSCGTTLTPGTLTAANYTQTFAYDTLNRLTSGPLGSYTYGDMAHLHAATAIGTGSPTYTATYDAGGNMTCRAPANPYACTGTPTGAQLSYDNEGRLAAWQNTPTSPTTTASYLYDGAGQRVQQAVTVNGSITTTTTYIAGGLEESVSSGAGTTLTKYFAAGGAGLPTLERVGTSGPVSVLASDGQGTVAESFDSSGTVTSAQLYTPYGVSRYSSGSSPTSHGYTGQVADSSTGLDYYNARYYDPVAGQFTSADTVADGLNRYGYVAGNPTTATDPSGHHCETDDGECGNGGGDGSGGHGGHGGSSGSVTHDCKTDLDDISNTCAQYRDWETRMRHKRWEALNGLRIATGIGMVLAIAADLAVDVMVIYKDPSVWQKITAIADIIQIIGFGVMPAVSMLFSNESTYSSNPDWENNFIAASNGVMAGVLFALAKIAGFARQMVGAVNGLLKLVKQLGSFGEAFVSGAIEAIKDGVGGPVTAAISMLMDIAGNLGFAYAEGASHAAYAAAYAAKGYFDSKLNMDIGDWCAQNKDQCTDPPQRYDTTSA